MDRDTFTETLVEWMEGARMNLAAGSVQHLLESDAYVRLVSSGRDVLPHVKNAYRSSISEYYWLSNRCDQDAFESIRTFGFPRLVDAVDASFSIPEGLRGDVNGRMAYTMDWLKDHA